MDSKSQSNLKRRYTQLVDQLSRTGAVLPGTITERRIIGQASQKQVDRKKYGPYYQWTRKVNGKTVTVNLSEAQVDLFQKAIDNNRKIEQILGEMKQISIQRLENETQCVKRRRL
jgi:multidrug efflux pump subunit AcrA (membrane-fusion protein)